MSVQANLVAETLEVLYDNLVTPRTIDAAQDCGKIGLQDVVLTSFGNADRSTITPFYPGFQFGCTLQKRLERARQSERPFIEAVINPKYDEKARLSLASVTLRMCLDPSVKDPNTVYETATLFALKEHGKFGTLESVLDEILRSYDSGREIPGKSGFVFVTKDKLNSKNGNWSLSKTEDPEMTALRIKIGASGIDYKRDFIS
jgi:hypothetical protein